MRNWLAGIALMLLAACIDVQDVGSLWEKAKLDPALEGVWVGVKEEHGVTNMQGERWQLVRQGDAYELAEMSDKKKESPTLARSLQVNGHSYLLAKDKHNSKGLLIRYSEQNGVVTLYGFPSLTIVKEWLKTQPNAPHLTFTGDMFSTLQIPLLNETTLQFIDTMPQWQVVGYFRKQ